MTTSHADSHDLDKLARWYDGLSTGQTGQSAVHAIFLVSAEDGTAHHIFRQFRSSFEDRGTPFHHLVIFGQHGFSSTVGGLLPIIGLDTVAIPVLVLYEGPSATAVYTLPLTRGSGSDDRNWMEVLGRVGREGVSGENPKGLATIPGVNGYQLGNSSVIDLVGRVLESLA